MIVDVVATSEKTVALSFDDGPDPLYTPQMLETLRRFGVRSTFFVIGRELERHVDLAERIVAAGHELGNHTYTHPWLTKLEEEARRDELERTDRLIRAVSGKRPTVFRPPFLAWDEAVVRLAESFGYATVGAANVEAADWTMPGVSFIVEKTLACLRPGAVLLFHDGGGDRSQTVEAVGLLLAELERLGYRTATVGELLAACRPD